MHRIDGDGNVANQFTEGDPSIPQVATQVTNDWLNDVQENICHAIESGGLPLFKGDFNQLAVVIGTRNVDQVFNGVAGDTNPALMTMAVPTARKLLWMIRINTAIIYARLYATATSGLEITINARWTGTQWVPDTTGAPSSKFKLEGGKMLYASAQGGPANFTDAALETRQFLLDLAAQGASFLQGGVMGVYKDDANKIQFNSVGNRTVMKPVGGTGPAFQNSWANIPGTALSYYLDAFNVLHLYGASRSSAVSGESSTIFTIPSGEGRPPNTQYFPIWCKPGGNPWEMHRAQVDASGNVSIPSLTNGFNWDCYFSGISWPVGSPP